MSTHPMHRFTETYIAERFRVSLGWVEVMRFPSSADARNYVRNNTPAFSPWRIVRLRTSTRSEVLEAQPVEDTTAETEPEEDA